jgi:hypothetical protein
MNTDLSDRIYGKDRQSFVERIVCGDVNGILITK